MRRTLLVGHDELVAEFVAKLAPIERPVFPPGYRAFGVLNDRNALISGVVFSEYMPQFGTIQLSAASVSSFALSTDIVSSLFGYAFRQLACNRLWARTAVKNVRATRILKHLGFTFEGAMADAYGVGQAAGTYRMLKREWLQKINHKEAA